MKFKPGTVPPHIVEQYGSARNFKAVKRTQLREAYQALKSLQRGAAFFPCGAGPIGRAQKELEAIYEAIKAEAWGR